MYNIRSVIELNSSKFKVQARCENPKLELVLNRPIEHYLLIFENNILNCVTYLRSIKKKINYTYVNNQYFKSKIVNNYWSLLSKFTLKNYTQQGTRAYIV